MTGVVVKNILLIATGGTIASVEDDSGLTPEMSGAQLTQYVPEIKDVCNFCVKELMSIDSTNMRPQDWMRISQCIVDAYDDYDGFVVLHGTDTMSYTAAALSYLIQDSAKPIVLTGSQKPMANPFTDAKINLYQALVYASDDNSYGVSIVFSGSVIAGTRARKQRTMSHNAFTSINFPELAIVRNQHVLRLSENKKPSVADIKTYNKLDTKVGVLKLTPGVNPKLLDLLKTCYDALIVETFGVGGIPDYEDQTPSFKEAIDSWVESGRTIVLTTQVPEEGCDMGVYEVGRAYAYHQGILLGEDMTTEALVAKTMWVLGQTRDPEQVKELFYKPINHDRLGV